MKPRGFVQYLGVKRYCNQVSGVINGPINLATATRAEWEDIVLNGGYRGKSESAAPDPSR